MTITAIVIWSSAVVVLLLRQFVDFGELPVVLIAVSASLVALAGTFDTARERRRGRATRPPTRRVPALTYLRGYRLETILNCCDRVVGSADSFPGARLTRPCWCAQRAAAVRLVSPSLR